MNNFMTEKEIESYLVRETRNLILSNGERIPLTAMRSLWTSLDCVTTMSRFTLDDLAAFARTTMDAKGYSFPEAFEAVVSFIHKEIRRSNGYA